jgi:hypothetical protein
MVGYLALQMASIPRAAFFTNIFTEINGVALTSRQITGFA